MVTLTAKDYYELSYDLIPDNKIQQVLGTTYEYSTSETSESKDVTQVTNLKGSQYRSWTLPAVDRSTWDTTDNYFENVFLDVVVNHSRYTPGIVAGDSYREEIVYAKFSVTIYNDAPMSYSSGAAISSASGINRTRTYDGSTFLTPGWLTNWTFDTNKIYGVANYNRDGAGSSKVESSNPTIHSIKSVSVDSYWNGSKIDQTVNKYRMYLTIVAPVYYGYMVAGVSESTLKIDSGYMTYDMYERFTITIPYNVKVTNEVEFEYHLDTTNYANYSLKVTGNEFTALTNTTYKTKVNEYVNGKVDSSYKRMMDSAGSYKLMHTGIETYKHNLWPEATFGRITEKYKDGKLYVSMRMKMSSAIKYSLNIDTELMLKDLNNKLIMIYDGDYYYNIVFKVKNIEYDCSETGYVANITLLEERGEKVTNYVVDSNDLPVVLSTGKKLYF